MERGEGSGFAQVVLQVAEICVAEFIGLEKSLCPRKAVGGRSGKRLGLIKQFLLIEHAP